MHLKFFAPDSNWTWFATEGQPQGDDFIFFGYVCGFEEERGYFMLSELASVDGNGRMPIERDLNFNAGPFTEVLARYGTERGKSA